MSKLSYLRSTAALISLTTNLGMLFTFGVVFPPLGVAFSVGLFVVIYCNKIELGRYVDCAVEQKKLKYKKLVEREFVEFGSANLMQNITWILITSSCLFYSLFLFDTLGDAVGFEGSYWVLIVVPLMPCCLYVVHRMLRRMTPEHHVVTRQTISMEIFDENKNPMSMKVKNEFYVGDGEGNNVDAVNPVI